MGCCSFPSQVSDILDFEGWSHLPVSLQFAINLQPAVDGDGLQFGEGDVAPFRTGMIPQEGISEEQIIPIVFGDVPVTVGDKEMEMNQLASQGDMLCFIEPWDPGKPLLRAGKLELDGRAVFSEQADRLHEGY